MDAKNWTKSTPLDKVGSCPPMNYGPKIEFKVFTPVTDPTDNLLFQKILLKLAANSGAASVDECAQVWFNIHCAVFTTTAERSRKTFSDEGYQMLLEQDIYDFVNTSPGYKNVDINNLSYLKDLTTKHVAALTGFIMVSMGKDHCPNSIPTILNNFADATTCELCLAYRSLQPHSSFWLNSYRFFNCNRHIREIVFDNVLMAGQSIDKGFYYKSFKTTLAYLQGTEVWKLQW